MQSSHEKSDECTDVFDTDLFNWEDYFFSENSQFSDVENAFDSKNLIKSLQSTTNKSSSQTDGASFCRDEIFRRGIVEALSCKKIKSSKFGKISASRNYIPKNEHKEINISSQKKNKPSTPKNVRESSDSDDFYSPNKKYKRSETSTENIFSNSDKKFTKRNFAIYSPKTCENSLDPMKINQYLGASKPKCNIMTSSNQKSLGNQKAAVSSQESCGSRMITSSQEVSISQNMNMLSQKISTSEKMSTSSQEISHSQKISTSSQEATTSQKMSTSSQEATSSQKMSTSSQEATSSQKMSISSQETTSSQKMSTQGQETTSSQKMSTQSQEISTSQKMSTSNQEASIRQKINASKQNISTYEEMIISSQENSGSQNISSSPEFCCSPKIIASSQESLGKRVMGISIEEDSGILCTSHSSSGTLVIITPKKSICQQTGILNQGAANSETISIYNQQNLNNGAVSCKKLKTGFSTKRNFAENYKSTISDSFYNKTDRRYNKAAKRIIWSIRKKELDVTKRENAVEIREKMLDSREADIEKREKILKAREQRCIASMKKLTKKSKNIEEKIRCLRR